MAGDSISTRNIWPNYAAPNVQSAAAKPNNGTLGKDQFLKILVEQLKNQNPMEPMQDREFIAQMAQFSSVEQLMNMSKEMALLRQNLGMASGLIGKTVEWTYTDPSGETTVTRSGIVDAITVKDGVQYVRSGEELVAVEDITSIAETAEEAPQDE